MTPEQMALITKAKESQKAAHLLADQGMFDFSASRAYYAMFYATQALLLEDELSFSSHAAVIAAFGKHFAKTGRVPVEYHRLLINAQLLRSIGDYGAGASLSEEKALPLLPQAADFIAMAERLLAS